MNAGWFSSEGQLPSFDGALGWLNSEPLTPDGLRGRVVLVDFWTYTCINWLRTLPYLRAWDAKYRASGLVVIGVHTPEFGFEGNADNIRRAVKELKVAYPVAIDTDYKVWRAFDNNYWPALYFADATGVIRDHHFGEGRYEESERMIQKLLSEAGVEVGDELVSVSGSGIEASADWDDLASPETYLGYERSERLAPPGGEAFDESHAYAIPEELGLNRWALAGDWTIRRQGAVLNEAGGRIAYRFRSRDLHLVMGSPTPGSTVRFRVLVDGSAPGTAHGIDVDERGEGTAAEQRLYQLVRTPGRVDEHRFEIEFLDPGLEANVFTFG